MLRLEHYGDVTRLVMSSLSSRLAGYEVSAFLTHGVLVDIGFPRIAPEMHRFLLERKPDGVMLTHSHEDHAGNAPLAAALDLPIAASDDALQTLHAAPRIEFYRRLVWGQPAPLPARRDKPAFEHALLRFIPTPGHSRDHQVVWDEERETVFGGDLFVGVKVRLAHADEDPREQVRSLRTVAALRPRRLFDAHRGLITDPAPALLAKADWMDDMSVEIERRIAAGWSDRAIARHLLGREESVHYVSAGHYSRINFVRAVRRVSLDHTVIPAAGAGTRADQGTIRPPGHRSSPLA